MWSSWLQSCCSCLLCCYVCVCSCASVPVVICTSAAHLTHGCMLSLQRLSDNASFTDLSVKSEVEGIIALLAIACLCSCQVSAGAVSQRMPQCKTWSEMLAASRLYRSFGEMVLRLCHIRLFRHTLKYPRTVSYWKRTLVLRTASLIRQSTSVKAVIEAFCSGTRCLHTAATISLK